VHINAIVVPKSLIDLRATINVMKKETIFKLDLQEYLRTTTTILWLADRSIVAPKCVIEYVMVSVYSMEYPKYFLIIQLEKSQWLSTSLKAMIIYCCCIC